MGEFKDKISKLSDSEMDEIWKKITSYQGGYIDDFLIELNDRGIRDEYFVFLTDHTLMDLFSKVKNSENIEFLNSLIEERGLSGSVSSYVEKNEKKKVNYTIPTAGIGILIVVIIKLLARNAGNELKNQREQYNSPASEVLNKRYDSIITDSINNSELKRFDFDKLKKTLIEKMFDVNSKLYNDLNSYKSIVQKLKSENNFSLKNKELLFSKAMKDNDLFFKNMEAELYKSFNLNPDEVKQIMQEINERYIFEFNQILESN